MRPVRRWTLALLLLAGPALGAVVQAGSVEDLARGSDAVVRGRVDRREARWSGDGMRIVTDVEVAVSGVWKGDAPGRVVVTVPGGVADGLAQRVDAAPAFADREEVVLFLVRRGEVWHVNGLALGKFRVQGAEAGPDLRELRVERRALAAGERAIEAMPVAELERRVRGAR